MSKSNFENSYNRLKFAVVVRGGGSVNKPTPPVVPEEPVAPEVPVAPEEPKVPDATKPETPTAQNNENTVTTTD